MGTLAPSSSTSASCSRRARSSSWSEREGRGGPRPFNNRPPSLRRANVLSRRELPLLRPGRPRYVAHICLGAYMQPQPRLGGGAPSPTPHRQRLWWDACVIGPVLLSSLVFGDAK